MNEFEVINRFFRDQQVRRDDVPLGIGDDAAVIRTPDGGELVTTMDVLVGGVHFPQDTAPEDIGYKALAVNLSDIAAMGAAPAWATLGLTLPQVDETWLAGFASGLLSLAAEHEVQLVGGDTTRGPLNVAVQVSGPVGGAGHLTRGGAREGDVILVSGTLGDAGVGLRVSRGELDVPPADAGWFRQRLNRPAPRVALGRALAGLASAAIDVSDGLVADLGHLCARSRAGATVEVSDLPLSGAYRRALGQVGLEPALSFGDDYELCFTVPPGELAAVTRLARESGVSVTPVGHIIAGDRITWHEKGEPLSLQEHGYRHF